MRQRTAQLTLGLVLAICCNVIAFEAHGALNLVPNASLETENPSNPAVPQSWKKGGYGTNVRTFTYPVAGFDGVKAARVEITSYTSGDAKWYFDDIPVTAGRQYDFADAYQSNTQSIVVLSFTLSNGMTTYVDLAELASTDGVWTTASASFTAPANAVSMTAFHLIKSVGYLTIDAMSISEDIPPPPDPANLIPNPGVEAVSPTNATLPASWARGGWGTNTRILTYPIAGDASAKAVRSEITSYASGDAKWYFTPIPVTPGQTYTFSDRYRSNVTSHITLQFGYANGSYIYQDGGTLASAPDWTSFQTSFSVPSGATNVTVFHLIKRIGWIETDNYALYANDASFSRGMVTLTLDDGLATQYANALPILEAADIPAVFYILSNRLQGSTLYYMTGEQVTDVQNRGYDVEAHTRSHPHLPALSPEQQWYEIFGSKEVLTQFGIPGIESFAYPFGEYDEVTLQAVKDAGYRSAVTTQPGFNVMSTDPYRLHRTSMRASTTIEQAKALIDEAAEEKSWVILNFHTISNDGGTYSVTPDFFQEIVNYLAIKDVSVVDMKQGRLQMEP